MASDERRNVGRETVERLREFTEALEAGEILSQRFRSKKIILDLRPEPYSPDLVRETRACLQVSQAMFAQFLGVETTTVQKWERGARNPDTMACRFMDEIRLDPEHYRTRLVKSIKEVVPT